MFARVLSAPALALVLAFAALGSAGLAGTSSTQAGGFEVSLNPTSGPPGQIVEVTISGANPTATICILYYEAVGQLGTLVAVGGVNADGTSFVTFNVPNPTALGPHEVSIHQRFGGCGGAQGPEVDIKFTVTTAPTPTVTPTTPPPTDTPTTPPTETPTATETTPPTATATTPPPTPTTPPPTETATTPPTATGTSVEPTETTPPTETATEPPTATATEPPDPTATNTAKPTKTTAPAATPTKAASGGIQPPDAGQGDGPAGTIGGSTSFLWVLTGVLGAAALAVAGGSVLARRRNS